MAWAKIYRESISLGRFGAQTRKPIHLFSNLPYISELPALYSHTSAEVPQSTGVVFRFLGDDGTVKVTGAALLKNTQAYPPNFGMALAQVYEEHRREIKKAAELQRFQQVREVKDLRSPLFGSLLDFVSDSPLCEDIWEDAALKPVSSRCKARLCTSWWPHMAWPPPPRSMAWTLPLMFVEDHGRHRRHPRC